MMRKTWWLSLALVLGVLPLTARAEVTIKLGTLAPANSPWHMLLKEAAEKWRAQSGGAVNLRIYAGGTVGNEGDMIKKMRIGQLHAAALTTIGLREITPEPTAMDLPMLARNAAEKDCLMAKIGEKMEAAVSKKGYVVLNFSEIGFVRFFTTKPRPTLTAIRQGKLFVWEGDPASVEAWKAGGFNTVLLSATDIIPSLSTEMIDTVAYPPTVALGYRLHDKAKYMTDLVWSSLTGALVIRKEAWEQIPVEHRQPFMNTTRDLGRRTVEIARKMEEESITKMKAQGLTVVHVTDEAAWQKAVDDSTSVIRGKVVPAETFDEVQRIVKQCQKGKKAN